MATWLSGATPVSVQLRSGRLVSAARLTVGLRRRRPRGDRSVVGPLRATVDGPPDHPFLLPVRIAEPVEGPDAAAVTDIVVRVDADGQITVRSRRRADAGEAHVPRHIIDPRRFSPMSFEPVPTAGDTAFHSVVDSPDHVALRARSVVLEPSDLTNERRILELAAQGAVLSCTDRAAAEMAFGGALADLLEPLPSDADARVRELRSIDLRRAVAAEHAPRGVWSGLLPRLGLPADAVHPRVTVLLATRRPSDIDAALEMVGRQDYPVIDVRVGLHGAAWSADDGPRLASAYDGDLAIEYFDDDTTLGTVLQTLTMHADGDLVTKWDDDDWYGDHHVTDLVHALDYSGADLVGKAAEFVRLESADLTVRRFALGAERFSSTLAGGTLLARRTTIEDVGGWPDAPRRVDQLLIERVRTHGGHTYRTHGFEYLLRRRPDSHTWSAPDAFFVRDATDQRPGLDLEFAGLATGPGSE